jgi:Chondroitinase B/Carbohydrate binding module (family 6)
MFKRSHDVVAMVLLVLIAAACSQAVDENVSVSVVSRALSACQSPYLGTARSIPGIIEAEHYDLGGQGCAYNDTTAGNSGNTLRTDSVDIQPASEGGHNIGWVVAGEWLKYTVNVTAAGQYRLELRTAATASGKTIDVLMESTIIADNLPVTNTGNFQTYATITVPQVTLAAGLQSMQVLFNQSSMNLTWIRFTALTCTPESNPTFCGRLGKNCGPVTAPDNCGVSRTVDCGTCTPPATCSAANVCETPSGCTRDVPVSTTAALATAVADAQPGDCIGLANGSYTFPTISKTGTAEAPIRIKAANRGMAVVSSGVIHFLNAAHVVVEGLDITSNGLANSGTYPNGGSNGMLIAFTDSSHCRLTRNRIHPSGPVSDRDWIVLTGAGTHHNRIDHNDLGPQTLVANMIVVDGTGQEEPLVPGNVSQHNQIDRNYFHDIGYTGGNNWEAVRVGRSWQGPTAGFNVVEYNLFYKAHSDPETVSLKSSDNTVRHNTMRATNGEFTLRHGNRNKVHGNYILGVLGADANSGSKGLRVYGADHRIFNNYIHVNGNGILLDAGASNQTEEPGKLHYQVHRAWVFNNAVIGKTIKFGGSKTYDPRDCRAANNIAGSISVDSGATVIQEGNTIGNPLVLQNGIYRNLGGSRDNAVNAAFYGLVDDIEGQARTAPDRGADEQSTAPITTPGPLTTADVGPAAP